MVHPNTLSGLSSDIFQGAFLWEPYNEKFSCRTEGIKNLSSTGWSGEGLKDIKYNKSVGALQVGRESVGKPKEDKRIGCTDTTRKYSWTQHITHSAKRSWWNQC